MQDVQYVAIVGKGGKGSSSGLFFFPSSPSSKVNWINIDREERKREREGSKGFALNIQRVVRS